MKSALLIIPALAFLYGCGGEPTQTYTAPKESSAPPSMQMPVQQTQAQPAGKGYEAELPEGWTETPGTGMRIVSYAIEGTTIDFYLISLSMGDLASNVNRWRGQVGLAPASAEEIEQAAQSLDINGHPMRYIETYNDEGGKGIIAAIIELAPQYRYFTAKGDVDELKANATDIRAFLSSIKIEGHNH